jgi:hypothetical protein
MVKEKDLDEMWSILSDDDYEYQYPYEDPFYYENKYLYAHKWYHENFPEEWAINNLEGTGPGYCLNCEDYGSINGVFIGYCVNCAIYEYEGTRGRGFTSVGVECMDNDVMCYPSAFDTYLKGVDINNIVSIDATNHMDVECMQHVYNVNDYLDADQYGDNIPVDLSDISILNNHFEGGYNDM